MKARNYKNIDIEKISVTKPMKINNVYTSNILYEGAPLYFQSPLLQFTSNKDISFQKGNNELFVEWFKQLRQKLIKNLYENSVDFFKGVQYDNSRLERSVKNFYTTDGETINLTNTEIDRENIKVLSNTNELTTLPEFPYNSICIMKLDSIVYKSDITCNIKINYIKLKTKKEKSKECFLGDEDDFYFA